MSSQSSRRLMSGLLLLAAGTLQAQITTVPPSLNTGDEYRLIFVTSGTRDASSTDIADYNAFVSGAANAVTQLADLGTTWTAVASTATVDAIDNTNSNPSGGTGVPIFVLDGSQMATDYANLWFATTHPTGPEFTELGDSVFATDVWTGTSLQSGLQGQVVPTKGLGTATPHRGLAGATTTGWLDGAAGVPNSAALRLYGMSDILTVPPTQFTLGDTAVGTAPCDVIAKDLTGDGAPDIATADSGSDSVTVLTNDGSGGFGSSTTIALTAGDAPAVLAAGDLVSGGDCDLAVAGTANDVVRIISNDPVGTFTVTGSLSTLPATRPVGIDVGDLDGGGDADVVVATEGDALIAGNGSVQVSLNGGALTALIAPAGGFLRPQRVAIADLDGDGDNDIAATMAGTVFAPTVVDNVLIYENLGGGSFAAPVGLSAAQNPRSLCLEDLDDDGDIDLAVTAESFPNMLPGTVEILINDGLTAAAWSSGSFSAGGSFSGGTSPVDVVCADLRDDSIPGFCALMDLVTVNFGDETLSRFDGYDEPTQLFADQDTYPAHLVPVAIASADFNGDKTPDLVVANKASDDVTILTAVTPALAKTFGTGCPGTGGLVPQIAADGLPTFSNPAFGIEVSNARPFAPVFMGLSLSQVTTSLGSCEIYLLPPLVLVSTITDGTGSAAVALGIPGASSPFAGCDAYFQYFVADANGAYNNQFAFSDALRIKVGN
jgi:hypothetical protein